MLTNLKDFRQQFAAMLTELYSNLDFSLTPQTQWEAIKPYMIKFIKKYSHKRGFWREKQLHALQRKRNKFLHNQKSPILQAQILPTIESQIATLQKELTDILDI